MTTAIASAFGFFAQAAQAIPSDSALTQLIAWGPSAAVIVSMVYLLRFFKEVHDKQVDAIRKISDDNVSAQDKLRSEIDKMGERYDNSQAIFQEQFQRAVVEQTKVLQSTVSVVGQLQGTVGEMRRSLGDMHVMLVKILPPQSDQPMRADVTVQPMLGPPDHEEHPRKGRGRRDPEGS